MYEICQKQEGLERKTYVYVVRQLHKPKTRVDSALFKGGYLQKDWYHDIAYMWNLKKRGVQMNLFIKQKQIDGCGKQTELPGDGGEG